MHTGIAPQTVITIGIWQICKNRFDGTLGKIKLRFNKETKSFYFPTKSNNTGDEQTDIHSDKSSHHGEGATGNPPQSESGDSDSSGNGDDGCHW